LFIVQLDIVAEFEIKNTTLEKAVDADEEYSCSTSNGAAGRGLLGPFGFLVLADKSLTEQTAVYFYISKNSYGSLKTHFCQDETRYFLCSFQNHGIKKNNLLILYKRKIKKCLFVPLKMSIYEILSETLLNYVSRKITF
jgi:beta-fructofuranosidase